MEKVFGYDYDENQEYFIPNKEESEVVKDVYYFTSQGFLSDESFAIINGKSMLKILRYKILKILINIQEKYEDIKSELIEDEDYFVDIDSILSNKNSRENYLLPILRKLSKEIKNRKDFNDNLITTLDDTIKIVDNFQELDLKAKQAVEHYRCITTSNVQNSMEI